MTALTKDDRIQISAKIVGIKEEKALSDATTSALNDAKTKAQAKDDSIKKLLDSRTTFINSYQKELKYLDGNVRTELTESVILDSANRVKNNSFFPVDPQTPLPSLPTGIWPNFIPYSKTHAVGKTNLEAYSSTYTRKEPIIIADINAKIALVELQLISNRATGKKCQTSGTCSINPGTNTTQALCTAAGGTWTPGPDVYSTNTVVTGLLTDIITLVQEWKDTLTNEKTQVPTDDTNSTRSLGNTNSISDINNSLSIIQVWINALDYDTTTPLPTGSNGAAVAAFNAKTESYFQQTKLQPTTLQNLKNELTARLAYTTLRIGELTGSNYLGSIVQTSTGSFTSATGLYGERIYFLDMRINLLSGSLTEVISLGNSTTAQAQIKEAANNAATGLALIMKAIKAIAPGIDTPYLNFESLTDFSPSDRVYIVADDQEELSGSIIEITGNRAKFTFNIPKKYTTANNTRLYKLV